MLSDLQIKETCLLHGFKLKEQADGSMDLNPYVYTAVKKCIELNEQIKNNGWISVDDELPSKTSKEQYLVYQTNGKMKVINALQLVAQLHLDKNITHWQPLPQAPKEI